MADFINDLMRGLMGLGCILAIAFAFGSNRKAINWSLVATGLLLQALFAVVVLKVSFVYQGLEAVAVFVIRLMDFTKEGTEFILGTFLMNPPEHWGYIIAFQVLPSIIFFSALTSALYYLGILQVCVFAFAWIMKKTMRLSGAESLAAAANVFVGQTEAPLMVKPYISRMTRSEILALMSGGMATIAGGVLVAYIGMLGGESEEMRVLFGTHFITASILSAPASLVIAKILIPETEPVNQDMKIDKASIGDNIFDALSRGTTDGIRLAVNIGGVLLVFTAMIAMVNYMLSSWIGDWTGLNHLIAQSTGGKFDGLTLQLLFALLFFPLAFLIGVPAQDLLFVGQLLGEKTVINEFVAYTTLGAMKKAAVFSHPKSVIIAAYALCGFANFASIGIQISNISILAPNQRGNLAALGFKALVAGTLACLMTACFAGILA
ncbi:MAG: hypothetical protein F7O42_02570 [Opitutae bacterium]|nr:hypothetical protein [Opitutae bacterium]